MPSVIMRLVMLFLLSLILCVITFGVIFVRISICARIPGEDWLLGFVLITTVVVPLVQALIFWGWVWMERTLLGGTGANVFKAIVLGVVAGGIVSLLWLYTDFF